MDLSNIANERDKVRSTLECVLEFKHIVILMNKVRECIDQEDYYMAINIINNIDTVGKLII